MNADGVLIKATLITIWLSWIAGGWLQIIRLSRKFQLTGYDTNRYLRLILNNGREIEYIFGSLVGCCVISIATPTVPVFLVLFPLPVVLLPYVLYGLLFCDGLVCFAILVSRPREAKSIETVSRTQRTTRLLLISLAIDAVPASILVLITASYFEIRLDNDSLWMAFILIVTVIAAIVALSGAPFVLPKVNIVNWPIEAFLRRSNPSSGSLGGKP